MEGTLSVLGKLTILSFSSLPRAADIVLRVPFVFFTLFVVFWFHLYSPIWCSSIHQHLLSWLLGMKHLHSALCTHHPRVSTTDPLSSLEGAGVGIPSVLWGSERWWDPAESQLPQSWRACLLSPTLLPSPVTELHASNVSYKNYTRICLLEVLLLKICF